MSQFVEGEEHWWPRAGAVDGVPYLVEERDDERSVERLGRAGGAEVDRIGGASKRFRAEVGEAGGVQCGVGAVGGEEAVGGGEDPGQLARVGVGEPLEDVGGADRFLVLQYRGRADEIAAVEPRQDPRE